MSLKNSISLMTYLFSRFMPYIMLAYLLWVTQPILTRSSRLFLMSSRFRWVFLEHVNSRQLAFFSKRLDYLDLADATKAGLYDLPAAHCLGHYFSSLILF